MAEYTAKKSNRGGPESSLEEADKVTRNSLQFGSALVFRGIVSHFLVGTIVRSLTLPAAHGVHDGDLRQAQGNPVRRDSVRVRRLPPGREPPLLPAPQGAARGVHGQAPGQARLTDLEWLKTATSVVHL
jgi:hypothetical protein